MLDLFVYLYLQVTATDQDRGANAEITYGIETNENANLPFTITPTTGEIRTSGRLDRETKSSYEISVTATDKGKNPLIGVCRFTITVTDINDNAPKFAFQEYRGKLTLNQNRVYLPHKVKMQYVQI